MSDETETKFDERTHADVALKYPVEFDAKKYSSLTMRRPKTKDSKIVAKSGGDEMSKGILLLANLCDVAPGVIEELDEYDAAKLGKQLEAFRGGQLN
jgi:Phage tail assembly chaperone proteins, E, or 41 or 14